MKEAIIIRESEKFNVEEVLVKSGKLTVLFVPPKVGFFKRRKIKKIKAQKVEITAEPYCAAEFAAEQLPNILKIIKAKGRICIVTGSVKDAKYVLGIIKDTKDAVILAKEGEFEKINELVLGETGAACTVTEFPQEKQDMVIFLPDSEYFSIQYSTQIINFSGKGKGITQNNIRFTLPKEDKEILKYIQSTDELMTIVDLFNIDKTKIKIAKIK